MLYFRGSGEATFENSPEQSRRRRLDVQRDYQKRLPESREESFFPWFAGQAENLPEPANIPGEEFLMKASITHRSSVEFDSPDDRWCTRLLPRRYARFRTGSRGVVVRSQPLILEH